MQPSRDPADATELRHLLRSLTLTPNKLRGQHFLIDPAVADGIVAASGVTSKDTVLEIGPGFGALTARLLQRAGKVIAVEADAKMAARLTREFRGEKRLAVFSEDILTFHRSLYCADGAYRLVASLPYSITARVFRLFLSEKPRPEQITVLVQQEVAERASAPAGKLSQLGVLCQLYGHPRILRPNILPDAFYPPPAVRSALLQLSGITQATRDRDAWKVSEQTLWKVVRAGFQNRRKMLKNTLSNLPEIEEKEVERWLHEHGYQRTVRAQDIAVHHWPLLAEKFFDE